jgi:hypothetical protein
VRVKLLKKMQAMKKSTFNDPKKFVFRNKSAKVVSRDEIVKALRKGAKRLKIPKSAVSALESRGASAMWGAKFSLMASLAYYNRHRMD